MSSDRHTSYAEEGGELLSRKSTEYHREGTIGENHPMTNRLGRRILPRQRDGVQDKRVGGANDWQGGPVEIFINKVASIVLKNAFSVWCGEVSSILNAPTLLSTEKQLERSLDEGITRLRQGGTRSVLFQVTLLAYGYTFLGNGTVRAFVSHLTHEAAVYNRLSPLQGRDVPVFLGAIDLRVMDKIYYFVHRVYVVHITFLSWGGDSLADALKTGGFTDKSLQSMAITALRAMHQEGVVHKDVLFSNMLFNREVKRVMMIDFEREVLVKPPRPPLAQLVPNKRRRKPEETECKKTATSSCNIRRVGEGFSKDILDAKMVFWDLDSRYGIAK
ncbi:hypothetical protein BFJ66_g16262 [Fusarium oxysporum f. sp. cepae]|nr:hypothetical protein BFJ66_g16262 [Fusarium oxysporum f. sp. cepae]